MGGRGGSASGRYGSPSRAKNDAAFYDSITPSEWADFSSYPGAGYQFINGALRGTSNRHDFIGNRMVPNIDRMFDRAPLSAAAMVVHRRSGGLDDLEVGDVFSDAAYTSTSTSRAKTDKFEGKRLEIRVPKGTPMLNVEALTKKRNPDDLPWEERERLLPRGSKFRVTGKDEAGNLTVQWIGQEKGDWP